VVFLGKKESDAYLVDERVRLFQVYTEMFTPSASRQSAAPHCEEAARFPCLATLTPADAQTMAEVVEMLNVCASVTAGADDLEDVAPRFHLQCVGAHGARTAGDLVAVVSARALFVERAARKAAFCVCVVSPFMISFMT
jgi:hypothetical protein